MKIVSIFFSCLFIVGCCCAAKEKTAVEKAEDARKEAEAKAKADALEKKCGKPNEQLFSRCVDLVKASLLRPSTADVSYVWGRAYDRDEATCLERTGSTVTSQNLLGVEIKHRFQCSYNPKTTKTIRLDFITLD